MKTLHRNPFYVGTIPKSIMAEVVTRLIYGIGTKSSTEYVHSLSQYKILMRKNYEELKKDFKSAVRQYLR